MAAKKTTAKKADEKETKKTTAKKTSTVKKANTNKTKTTKKATTAKTTTPKKKTAPKKTTTKKTTTKAPKKVEKVVEQETDVVIAPVVEEEPVEVETFIELTEPTVIEEDKKLEEVIEKEIELEKTQELSLSELKEEVKKAEKRIDIGIGIVLLGLIILIVTTYLSSATDIAKNIIDGLVVGSLAIEFIGIIVIIYNTIKSNR
jgi:hypothetical protein